MSYTRVRCVSCGSTDVSPGVFREFHCGKCGLGWGTVNPPFDPVTRPEHYTKDRVIQPLDVIEDWDLPHHLACVIKYIARYGRRPEGFEGVKKAAEYLRRFLILHGEL